MLPNVLLKLQLNFCVDELKEGLLGKVVVEIITQLVFLLEPGSVHLWLLLELRSYLLLLKW